MPTTSTIICSADTYLDETGVSPTGGNATFDWGWSGGRGFQNPLLTFNISALKGKVVSATLRLVASATETEPGSRDGMLGVLKPSTPWVESTADWDEYDTGLSWTTAGLDPDNDFAYYPDVQVTVPQVAGTFDFDVTSLVRYAKQNGLSTVTIGFYNQDGGLAQQTITTFFGRTSFSAQRPRIIVTTKPANSSILLMQGMAPWL